MEINPTLAAGSILRGDSPVSCPHCKGTVIVKVRLEIQNLAALSMILWPHEEYVQCPECKTVLVPLISAFDPNALRWTVSPVKTAAERPLIEVPGQTDISKILKN